MADQLLSQADVNALVASLAKSEPRKSIVNQSAPMKPVPASLKSVNSQVAKASIVPNIQNTPPKPVPVTRQYPISTITLTRQEPKSDVSAEIITTLNTKVADLTKQLGQVGVTLRRLGTLEKRISDLEVNFAKNQDSSIPVQKVQLLDEELTKMTANLKGTPAYGVHNSFTCEKCNDHGHVATLFRCTRCGHERWYGWWPKK